MSALHSLCPGDWMILVNLQDAYLQVPVHPESLRYLRFCLGHQTFQFWVLCFGLSSALQVFTRVMAPISSIMYRFGHRVLGCLDDWLVLGSSLQEITQARDFLLWLCRELGVQVNLSKSSVTLTQTLDYLGMTLQSTPLRAFPTQARIRKCSLSSKSSPPLESSHSVFGILFWESCPRCPRSFPDLGSTYDPCSSALMWRVLRVVGGLADLLGRLLPPGSSVVACCQPSRRGSLPRSASSTSFPLHRCVGLQLGCFTRQRPSIRLVASGCSEVFPSTTANSLLFC